MEFLNRHRNKILLLGGTAGVGILILNKVFAHYEKQWQSNASRGFVHDVRKKEIHFENIIDECNQLCRKLCPRISKHLHKLLDVTKIIQQSKPLAASQQEQRSVQSKVETWKLLKVKILTRLLSEIYCTCLTICYLRILKSVAGGMIFAKSIGNNGDNHGSSSATVADLTHIKTYTKLNSLISSMKEQKFNSLIEPIEEAVEETLSGFSVDYKISIEDFKDILDKVKRSMSFFLLSPNFKIGQLFLDKNTTLEASGDSMSDEDRILMHKIISDSQAILDSEQFKEVLEGSIEVAYEILIDNLRTAFIKMDGKLSNNGDQIETKIVNLSLIKLPIVKILPQILESYSERSESEERALMNHLLSLDSINCYAANVYDEFCFAQSTSGALLDS